ncbi:hypothetical protein EV687_0906 [Corticibacter populi]|nr:hypothetical protein EV687_0906 [Corticibacter populi]
MSFAEIIGWWLIAVNALAFVGLLAVGVWSVVAGLWGGR